AMSWPSWRKFRCRTSRLSTLRRKSAATGKRSIDAHKTGTGGTQNGITSATNDIGIIILPDGRHLAVAAFVSDSAANDDTRDAIVARLVKAAWDRAQSLGQ